MRVFTDYIKSSIDELRKVVWPNRSDVIRHSTVIVFSIIIAGLVVGAVDAGLGYVVDSLLLK